MTDRLRLSLQAGGVGTASLFRCPRARRLLHTLPLRLLLNPLHGLNHRNAVLQTLRLVLPSLPLSRLQHRLAPLRLSLQSPPGRFFVLPAERTR